MTALGTLGAVAIVGALLFPRGSGIEDPTDVHSTTHSTGRATPANVVGMAWTWKRDADAYSVTWTRDSDTLPDEMEDLAGEAGRTVSPPLTPGSWWFHLRTKGGGDWTHTVHVGPFIILPRSARPEPAKTPQKPKKKRNVVARARPAAEAPVTTPVFIAASPPPATGVAGVSSQPDPPSAPAPPTTPATPPPPEQAAEEPPTPPTTPATPPPDPAPPAPPPVPADPAPVPPTTPPDLPADPDRPPPDQTPTLPPEGIEVEVGTGGEGSAGGQGTPTGEGSGAGAGSEQGDPAAAS